MGPRNDVLVDFAAGRRRRSVRALRRALSAIPAVAAARRPLAPPPPHATSRRRSAALRATAAPSAPDRLPGFQACPAALAVAYQGEPGAYSEGATLTAYPECELVPCATFEDAFVTGESGAADRVVLPFENSLGGSIHRNYDLMLTHGLHIVGEVNFRVRHCLLALPGTEIGDVTRVLSHPQALAQCDGYLGRLNGGAVVRESRVDTAGSAKVIRDEGLAGAAAVASERAAELYGMAVLDRDLQDNPDNLTRFLALSRTPLPPDHSVTRRDPGMTYKTSLVFAFKDAAGTLFKSLACFALRDINLTKVESRPLKKEPLADGIDAGGPVQFQYLFYVDCEASLADEAMQNALRNLEEHTLFLRVLGSYPRHTFTDV